jgi:hypothetical protein
LYDHRGNLSNFISSLPPFTTLHSPRTRECRFYLQKSGQLFVGTRDEMLSVTMRVCNPDRIADWNQLLDAGETNSPPHGEA